MGISTCRYRGASIEVVSRYDPGGFWRVRMQISRANAAVYAEDFTINFPEEQWALVAGICEAQRIVDATGFFPSGVSNAE